MAKKWIKGAIKRPGSLKAIAKRAGALKEDGTINVAWLKAKAAALSKKAKGKKKLSKTQLSLLRKINLALKLRTMPKRGRK